MFPQGAAHLLSSPSPHPTTTIDLWCSGVTSDSKAVDFMTPLQRCELRHGGPIAAVLLSPFVYEMNGVGGSRAPVSPVLCLVRGSTVVCIVKPATSGANPIFMASAAGLSAAGLSTCMYAHFFMIMNVENGGKKKGSMMK